MANEVCYWDEVGKVQKVRDATPEELSEIAARPAVAAAERAAHELAILRSNSYKARLRGKAATASKNGDTATAMKLLLKASEV